MRRGFHVLCLRDGQSLRNATCWYRSLNQATGDYREKEESGWKSSETYFRNCLMTDSGFWIGNSIWYSKDFSNKGEKKVALALEKLIWITKAELTLQEKCERLLNALPSSLSLSEDAAALFTRINTSTPWSPGIKWTGVVAFNNILTVKCFKI